MAAPTISKSFLPSFKLDQKGMTTISRAPHQTTAPAVYNFSPTPAGLLHGEKSAKELLEDLAKHRTPRTAVISWPSVGANDMAEYSKRLQQQPCRGDSELLMVRSSLEQNTSLRTLMLLNRLEEIRLFRDTDARHTVWGKYDEETKQAQVYNGVYEPRLREMMAIVQGLGKNKTLKTLWITNWCKGGSYDWFSCGAYDGWREMIQLLAHTLETNTTLETLDLRMTTVPFVCDEDGYPLNDDERDDSIMELSTGELVPTSLEGEYPYVYPIPKSEGGSGYCREDEPVSASYFSEYGWGHGTDWSQTDYYCQEISTFAPLTLGRAIRDRAHKGIPTTLKGIPLSRAWKHLGLPRPRPSWECPGPDGDSGDEAVNRDSGNEAIIAKWLEEGRAKQAA
jgi:hypothetical protein